MTLSFAETPRLSARIRSKKSACALASLVLVAALVRIPTLGEQSYWFDESRTVVAIHASFIAMLGNVYRYETTPQVYYVLAWMWTHIVGYGEFGLRFLSAIAGVLTVPVAFRIGQKLHSTRAGLTAAAVTASSPMLVWYSQEARAYSLMVLLSSLGLYAFVQVRDKPTSRWIGLWALISCLSLSTHYYTAITVIPEGMWLLRLYHRDSRIWCALIAVMLCGVALVPEAEHQARQFPNGGGWISSIPLGTRLTEVFVQQFLGPSRIFTPVALTIDLSVVGLAALALCRRSEVRRACAPTLALAGSGVVIFALSIASGHDLLDPRNILAIWMPLMVTVSIALASYTPVPPTSQVATIGMCVVGIATVTAVDLNLRLQRPPWSRVARAVGEHLHSALFEVNGCQLLPLQLYLPRVTQVTGPRNLTSLDILTTTPQPTNYDVLMGDWYTVCSRFTREPHLPVVLNGLRRHGSPLRLGQFTLSHYSSDTAKRVSVQTLASAGLRGQLIARRRQKASRAH